MDNICTKAVISSPRAYRYRARLDFLKDCKHEMAKIYRECRSGTLDVNEASKLVFVLATIGKTITETDFEARLDALEKVKK